MQPELCRDRGRGQETTVECRDVLLGHVDHLDTEPCLDRKSGRCDLRQSTQETDHLRAAGHFLPKAPASCRFEGGAHTDAVAEPRCQRSKTGALVKTAGSGAASISQTTSRASSKGKYS